MYHEKEARIYQIPVRIFDLVRKVRDGEIVFPGDTKSWNVRENRSFVENVLLGIQPNDLLFQVKEDGQWIVRHGFETIKSIYAYLVETDSYLVKTDSHQPLAFPLRYEGITSTHIYDLKPIWYNSINEYVMKCTMISPSTPAETVEDLVERFCGVEV